MNNRKLVERSSKICTSVVCVGLAAVIMWRCNVYAEIQPSPVFDPLPIVMGAVFSVFLFLLGVAFALTDSETETE